MWNPLYHTSLIIIKRENCLFKGLPNFSLHKYDSKYILTTHYMLLSILLYTHQSSPSGPRVANYIIGLSKYHFLTV